ncbi:hypothetical protein QE152_g12989 [Popillia japonica]|uniref:Uncharacterized protein n=1 Tax=Popillia japonica TaxID=7064 RepID=A0AAW1LB82_POPJA
MDRTFRGHSTVNHRTNFVVPAREQDPHWVPVGRFNEACLDRRMRGPPRADGQVPFRSHTQTIERCWRDLKQSIGNGGQVPFRSHTQTIERCWRDLKQSIGNGKRVDYSEEYIGEWIYRKNILGNVDGGAARFERFMNDIRRAYPGIALRPMQRDLEECDCRFMNDIRRAYPGIALRPMQRDLEECDCHECHPP